VTARRICLAILLVLAAMGRFAHADEQEIRTCDFQVKARCASGDVRVTLAHGAVQRVEIDVYWCGLPHRPGYAAPSIRLAATKTHNGLKTRVRQ
jgi:hypothetical protein